MKNYIKGVLEQFTQENGSEVIKNVKTPASDNLFRVRKRIEEIEITKHQSSQFHSTVAKLLFLTKRGRPDILLALSFLTARVKSPDLDDWKKLLRVLGYLKETLEYDLTISCKDLGTLTWYIDGSYATHEDTKGHNGAVMTIGNNVVLLRSNKQKVNTRSLTEAELIAVDDTLPTVQWTESFMKDQGYDLETIIKEDNKSSILLMKNGRLSSGKRTKHLDIRYFYVKDLLRRGIVKIEHCKTENMIADFFTKPLQGKRFQVLRDLIQNKRDSSTLQYRSMLGNNITGIL
jgi:hypothetical protein